MRNLSNYLLIGALVVWAGVFVLFVPGPEPHLAFGMGFFVRFLIWFSVGMLVIGMILWSWLYGREGHRPLEPRQTTSPRDEPRDPDDGDDYHGRGRNEPSAGD